ncbi:Utp14 protein-domain-containing protein [Kalaharituber pfeilii]|nr:Utp14 protein-domain-containing protein [Kalaharituber pfeilii]
MAPSKLKSTRRSRARANPHGRALNALTAAEQDLSSANLKSKKSAVNGNKRGSGGRSPKSTRKDARDDSDGDDDNEAFDGRNDITEGSDEEGNKWMIGKVNPEDDSELDSDEAMGESDEERFAEFTFRGSSTRRKEGGDEGGDEEDEEESEEDEEDGEGTDLLRILDQRIKEDEEERSGKGQRKGGKKEQEEGKKGKKRTALVDSEGEGEMDRLQEMFGDMNDEDEDEEDEEEGDDEDMISESDSDAEAADPEKLSTLRNLISTLSSTTTSSVPQTKRPRLEDSNELKAPSEYNISLSASSKKLTIDDLLPTINDPLLKKSLKLLAGDKPTKSGGVPGKLSAPLPRRQQEKIDRALAYEKAKEELNRWTDTVKHNREADRLHFPLPDPEATSVFGGADARLVSTAASAPLTSLEATVSNILKQSHLESEKQIAEFEALKTNKLSVEEVQKRTAQLRMARELLYREEIKAKRIKKIKSKAWRRIHKREREKQHKAVKEAMLAEGAIEEDEEDYERRRAEERISLRHKQSRWAKGLRESGRAMWDEEARDDAVEMVRRGEELQRRIMGKREGSDEESDEEESESEVDQFDEVKQQKLLKELEEAENSRIVDDSTSMGRLMQMKFMKNAEMTRRKMNEEAIKQLREELEYEERGSGEEQEEDEEEEVVSGRMSFKPAKNGDRNEKGKERKRNERVTEEGYHVGSDVEMDEKGEEKDDEDMEIIINTGARPPQNQFSRPWQNSVATTNIKTSTATNSKNSRPFSKPRSPTPTPAQTAPNPWLAGPSTEESRLRPSTSNTVNATHATKTAKANAKLAKERRAMLQKEQDERDGGGDEDVIVDTSVILKLGATPAPAPALAPAAKGKNVVNEKKVESNEITSLEKSGPANPTAQTGGESDAESDSENPDDEAATTLIQPKNPIAFTQRDLVRRAFAGDDVVTEFEAEKAREAEEDESKEVDLTLPGWGSWSGPGISKSRRKSAPRRTKIVPGVSASARQDRNLQKVIISEKRVKKNDKYHASTLPFPFETREQYERSLRVPLGKEWKTKRAFQEGTTPRVLVKRGVVVEAMKRPLK